jgi:uncharacterized protein YcbK (DUF882 family)
VAVDTKELNPVYAAKLDALLRAAKAAGINPGYLESAYRPVAQQAEIYERSGHGKKFMAAPPGHSMHGVGLAADIVSPDIWKLRAFATAHPEYGIYPLPGDTPHFQLAGNQRELMAHPPTAEPGAAPVNFAWNLGPNKEGTWGGSTTLNTAAAPGVIDPGIVARGGASPAIPDASGGTAVAAAPAAPAPPTFGESIAKGDVGGALKALATKPPSKTDDKGNQVEQKSTLENVADAFGSKGGGEQKAAPQIPEMAPAPVVTDPMMGMAPAAQQLFQTVAQAAAKPLSWTSDPYGSNAGLQRIRQGGGTTLNNTGYGFNG